MNELTWSDNIFTGRDIFSADFALTALGRKLRANYTVEELEEERINSYMEMVSEMEVDYGEK